MPELPRYDPMLAIRWGRPFSDPEWAFEVKWDGIRALASWDGKQLTVRSRTGRGLTEAYPELDRLEGLPPCILDGEIVAFDELGRPSFSHLQQRASVETPISYMVFDLLYLDAPMVGQPWVDRRERLDNLELPTPYLTAEPVLGDGEALWEGVAAQKLEGIVGKRLESPYRPGARSGDWRKVARVEQVRAVVGGYLPGDGNRSSTFGSLLLGLVDGDALRYVGSVGTGFTASTLRAIRSGLDELAAAASPFHTHPDIPPQAVFVEPSLVALVEFKEWTRAAKLRAPSFKGFTDDDWEAATWAAEGPPAP